MEDPITLPERPSGDNPTEYWEWIALACKAMEQATPYGEAPEYLSFHHTEEYKEQAEREAAEDECSPRARELVDLVLQNKVPKKKERGPYFFVRERFRFAHRMAKAIATMPGYAKPGGVAESPTAAPIETVRRLAIDVYDAGHFWETRWSQKRRYEY